MENNRPIESGLIEFKKVGDKPTLDDIWFMAGSRCNLSCAHCYVDASPRNDTLDQMTLEDIMPFLEEAGKFAVENIYFTGGEPFINKDITGMIGASLDYGNVTVLTNATNVINRHIDRLKELREGSGNDFTLRVSLDHYDEEKHDRLRGKGKYKETLGNISTLLKSGFKLVITASAIAFDDNSLTRDEVEKRFKNLFIDSSGSGVEIKFLPYTLEMGANIRRIKEPTKQVFISRDCMARPGIEPEDFQCYNGRTVEKINGKMKVYPCPIIYNDPQYELADCLEDSFKEIYLKHKACFDFCYQGGGKCTN